MISKEPSSSEGKVLITFELSASLRTGQIHLVGDFNGLDPTAHPLTQRRNDEVWAIALELEVGRTYQFRYLIDGERWCTDSRADGCAPNPHGGDNSVVVASLPPESMSRRTTNN